MIAVDNSAAMVERCRQYLTAQDSMFRELLPVQVLEADILALPFEPASVVAMNFTLQFIAPDQRLALLGRIRQALLPGGALVLSEKLRFADDRSRTCSTSCTRTSSVPMATANWKSPRSAAPSRT